MKIHDILSALIWEILLLFTHLCTKYQMPPSLKEDVKVSHPSHYTDYHVKFQM